MRLTTMLYIKKSYRIYDFQTLIKVQVQYVHNRINGIDKLLKRI